MTITPAKSLSKDGYVFKLSRNAVVYPAVNDASNSFSKSWSKKMAEKMSNLRLLNLVPIR